MGKLFRSGELASVAYTTEARGVSDAQLQKVRALSGHAQFGSHRGRVPFGALAQSDAGAVGQAQSDGTGFHARAEPRPHVAIGQQEQRLFRRYESSAKMQRLPFGDGAPVQLCVRSNLVSFKSRAEPPFRIRTRWLRNPDENDLLEEVPSENPIFEISGQQF